MRRDGAQDPIGLGHQPATDLADASICVRRLGDDVQLIEQDARRLRAVNDLRVEGLTFRKALVGR
jgi:hypothetical protein